MTADPTLGVSEMIGFLPALRLQDISSYPLATGHWPLPTAYCLLHLHSIPPQPKGSMHPTPPKLSLAGLALLPRSLLHPSPDRPPSGHGEAGCVGTIRPLGDQPNRYGLCRCAARRTRGAHGPGHRAVGWVGGHARTHERHDASDHRVVWRGTATGRVPGVCDIGGSSFFPPGFG